jgi:hypothetical protein
MRNTYSKILIVFFLSFGLANPVGADVGQTFDLKEQRKAIVEGKKDSAFLSLNKVDQSIFQSYDETVKRLSDSENRLEQGQRFLVLFASLALVLLVLTAYLLFVLNERLNQVTGSQASLGTTLAELSLSLLFQILPSKESLQKGRGVHLIIFFCLIGMLVSMVGYLLNLIF